LALKTAVSVDMEAGKVGDSNEIAPEWQERQCYGKKSPAETH